MKGIKKRIRDNRYLNWLLILSNWIFQSIPNADITEKLYKIFFTFFFWIIFYFLIDNYFGITVIKSIILSFILAHTLNWIVNGNFYNLIIHRLMLIKLSKKNLFNYLETLEERIENQNWILYAASFGSVCKGTLKDTSDLDISIVRKRGFKNGLLSIAFAVKEKKLADIKGIPLEIYISDSPENSKNRFRCESNPVVLFDPENVIDDYYQDKLSVSEAKILNKVW